MSNNGQSKNIRQDKSVYALSFATAVSFMGIGLVDPILPAISKTLNASPSQAMLLFTSYLIITAISMYFTAYLAEKLGVRKTLIIGLVLVVVFSAASSLSYTVNQIILWRAFWGLGNALFISTALAAIVSAAIGGVASAIILYESAIGIGMAFGPLAGGMLGHFSWRLPFAGTATLMLIGLVAILIFYKPKMIENKASINNEINIFSAFKALKNKRLRRVSYISLAYNMVFFIVLAYSPFPLESVAATMGLHFAAIQLGLIFFVWGCALAISSIIVTPRLTKKYGLAKTIKTALFILTIVLLVMALGCHNLYIMIGLLAMSGFLFGVLNTSLTEAVMEIKEIKRSIVSSAYSGVRFLGGAISSALAGPIAAKTFMSMPYFIAAIIICIAFVYAIITSKKHEIPNIEDLDNETEAQAISIGAD